MRMRIVGTMAFREVRAAARGRWFLVGALSFALLSIAVAELGMAGAGSWGISTVDRTTAALLNLVLLFVPLLGIPLGAESFAGEEEDGTLGYLIAQPVRRSEVFLGKLAGLGVAISLSLGLGFGLAAIWIGFGGTVESATFWALAGGAWLLGLFSVSLGVLFASMVRGRMRALALSIAAWVLLVFLCDFGVLALAAAQVLGSGALFGISVANPLQAVKTLIALFMSERLEVLGPVGVHAVRELGRLGLAGALGCSIAVWMALVTAGAFLRFRKEDLM